MGEKTIFDAEPIGLRDSGVARTHQTASGNVKILFFFFYLSSSTNCNRKLIIFPRSRSALSIMPLPIIRTADDDDVVVVVRRRHSSGLFLVSCSLLLSCSLLHLYLFCCRRYLYVPTRFFFSPIYSFKSISFPIFPRWSKESPEKELKKKNRRLYRWKKKHGRQKKWEDILFSYCLLKNKIRKRYRNSDTPKSKRVVVASVVHGRT